MWRRALGPCARHGYFSLLLLVCSRFTFHSERSVLALLCSVWRTARKTRAFLYLSRYAQRRFAATSASRPTQGAVFFCKQRKTIPTALPCVGRQAAVTVSTSRDKEKRKCAIEGRAKSSRRFSYEHRNRVNRANGHD